MILNNESKVKKKNENNTTSSDASHSDNDDNSTSILLNNSEKKNMTITDDLTEILKFIADSKREREYFLKDRPVDFYRVMREDAKIR
jgi:hypothetical protein